MSIDPAIVIRRFRDADGPDVRTCMVEEQNAIRAFDPRMPEGTAMVDAFFQQTMEVCQQYDGVVFVAAHDQQVIGFVTLLKRLPHSGADDVPGTYAAIADVAVRSTWRGRGIGTALLQQAEAEARASGASKLRLDVLSKNQRAMDLYQRVGFLPYALTMEKRFDTPST